ncbi:hypothetical protein HTZ77_09085 [Nonomuraea sp. SMC257]|uniref:Uncharacterized protein n=1 Tax=Nonomuraea montanisoli TaxID=2741721 RepID=A0A7Y6M1F2_9ACTN|nr:hypothetical protein [Nonomuraea montanisoli]NUW31578.1 hypothetical protein [Nonomuraea montanisoli]
MKPDPQPKDAAWPWLLFLLWILGTPLLGALWFSYGFALAGGQATNKQLSQICGYAMLIVGFGAPMLGLLLALASKRRNATIVFTLALIAVAVFWARLALHK